MKCLPLGRPSLALAAVAALGAADLALVQSGCFSSSEGSASHPDAASPLADAAAPSQIPNADGATAEASSIAAGDADAPATDAAAVSDAGATVVLTGAGAAALSATAHGQNYWDWVGQYGDQVDQVEDGAAAMHFTVLRAGGHNNDNNSPEAFDNAHVDAFVAYARATGAEPILQVPLLADTSGNRPTAATAAALVTYANITQRYGIRYWEIGNEPDLYSDQGDLDAGYTAQSYCADFASFAQAMRAVDPTIRILGPELSYKYVPGNDWLTPFLMGCGSKVDIVSVHRYPFAAADCTIANAMDDAVQFRATLNSLRSTMNSLGMQATPLAVTEANFSYQGDPTLQTQPAALGTFYAGMWVADVTGVALEENLWTLAFWSIDEGFLTGFFTSDTFLPQPAAYAYELVTRYFGPTVLHATAVPAGLSAYGSRDDAAAKTVVVLLNRTAAATTPVIGFTSLVVPLPNWTLALPPYSITLLELHDDGTAGALLYTKDMADQGLPPQPE